MQLNEKIAGAFGLYGYQTVMVTNDIRIIDADIYMLRHVLGTFGDSKNRTKN